MKCSFQSRNQVTGRTLAILPKLQLIFCADFPAPLLLRLQEAGRYGSHRLNAEETPPPALLSLLTLPAHPSLCIAHTSTAVYTVWPLPDRCCRGILITMETAAGILVLTENKKTPWRCWALDQNCPGRIPTPF